MTTAGPSRRFVLIGGVLAPAAMPGFVLLLWTTTPLPAGGRESHQDPIRIVAHASWWEVDYPGHPASERMRIDHEVHLPAGQPTELELVSQDAALALWVPEIYLRVDLAAGARKRVRVSPERPGAYPIVAVGRFDRPGLPRLTIVVDSAEGFAAWQAGGLR